MRVSARLLSFEEHQKCVNFVSWREEALSVFVCVCRMELLEERMKEEKAGVEIERKNERNGRREADTKNKSIKKSSTTQRRTTPH